MALQILKVLTFILFFNDATPIRILCVFPTPSISHQIVFRTFTEHLINQGDELIIVTTDPVDNEPENMKQIDVHNVSYPIWNEFLVRVADLDKRGKGSMYVNNELVLLTLKDIFDAQMKQPQMEILKDAHFDLLVIESFVWSAFGFTYKFKTPVIAISSFTAFTSIYEAVGAPTHPMLYHDFYREKLFNLSFLDRMEATYGGMLNRYHEWVVKDELNVVNRRHFGQNAPDISELYEQCDALILNLNPLWEGIRPVPSTLVYMGGIHIKTPNKFPKEVQNVLDSSPMGIIYMSLGSNIRSADLSEEIVKIFVDVFRDLPYRVLWKWEEEELPGRPDNVIISKWFQQPDILRHPNVKIFITHGGLQSTEEAIASHVPLIGLPFYADQHYNVQRYQHYRIGIALNMKTLTNNILLAALKEVMDNNVYKKNIIKLSSLLSDQPQTPRHLVAWWTQLVIKHGGAGHLRAPIVTFTNYFMPDVLAVILSALTFGIMLITSLVWYIMRFLETFGNYRKVGSDKYPKKFKRSVLI